MATLYADQNMTLSAGTPRVVENTPVPTSASATGYIVNSTTGVTIPVTFAAAGTVDRIIWRHYNVGYLAPTVNVCVDLEEYVGAAWVQRTNDVFAYSEANFGCAWGPVDLPLTPYAVTTAASTWRYRVYRQSGPGNLFYIYGTPTQAECLVVFSAATTSTQAVTTTDNLWVGKNTTYTWDQSFNYGACAGAWAIYCCDKANLAISTSEVAPFTITTSVATTCFAVSTSSKIYLGNSTSDRVPAAGACILDTSNTGSGTYFFSLASFYGPYNNAFYGFSDTGSGYMYYYGDYPTLIRTEATATAASGQPTINVADDPSAAGWAAGDTVSIVGHQAAVSIGTPYTIDSVTTTSVTFTTNLTYPIIKGAALINKQQTKFGVQIINSGAHENLIYASWLSGIEVNGLFTQGVSITLNSLDSTTRKSVSNYLQSIVTNGVITFNSAAWDVTNYHQYVMYTNPGAMATSSGNNDVFTKCTFNGGYTNGGLNLTQSSNHTFTDCIFGSDSYGGNRTSANYVNCSINAANITFTDCAFFNGYMSRFYLTKATFTNCSWQYVYTGLNGHGLIDVKFIDCDFGGEVANDTADIYAVTGYIQSVLMDNCKINTGIFNMTNSVAGSYIRADTYDQTTNDHRGYETYGKYVSTGTSLTDTTVHTAGGFAMRFEPLSSTNNETWSFTQPTGNITGLDAAFSIWVKINNAAYWAGTNQLPRLTVNYDNGTTAYAQAAQLTTWQKLIVPVTPATTYGQWTITLSARTDATTTNAYVYWDDRQYSHPSGSTINTGAMDNWAEALPVSPVITIPLSSKTIASDVWEELTTSHVSTSTFGKFIQKYLKLIPPLLGKS